MSGLVAFRGILRLRGAVATRLAFLAYPGNTATIKSCADVSSGGTPSPAGQKPQFRIASPPAGSNVFLVASVLPYGGPGTYGKAAIRSGGGASITVGTATYNPLGPAATASVTIRSSGGGTFTFRNATAADPAGRPLSGSVSWECSG